MATKKSEAVETKKVINMDAFFSRKNEENGVWFRPIAKDYVPFQLCVVGPTSSKAWVVNDEYSKGLNEAKEIKDLKEKAEKIIEVSAKRYAGLCIHIKVDEDVDLRINGKPVSDDDIYEIMYNSPVIQDEVYRFYNESESFLGIKKND